jgi:hypothetical protein
MTNFEEALAGMDENFASAGKSLQQCLQKLELAIKYLLSDDSGVIRQSADSSVDPLPLIRSAMGIVGLFRVIPRNGLLGTILRMQQILKRHRPAGDDKKDRQY